MRRNSVSVVIPTFNRAEVIGAAIESVMAQIGEGIDVEIIVIDDGSMDATPEALARYGQHIRCIRTENKGVSAARNLGIRESRSKWVAFLDSDDLWHPSKLTEQLECLVWTGSQVCFCFSQSDLGQPLDDLPNIDEGSIRERGKKYSAGDVRVIKCDRHPFVQSMIVDRALLLEIGGFDESLCVAEDTKLIYQLVLSHGYSVVAKNLVTIKRNRQGTGLSDSIDAKLALKRYECYLRAQGEIVWRLVSLDVSVARIVRRRMLYFASRAAEIAAALGEKQRARAYACFGLAADVDWKSIVRNAAILMVYPLAHQHFAKKWRVERSMSKASTSSSPRRGPG